MGWLFKENAFWVVLAGILGALVTWFLTLRKVTVSTVREHTVVDAVSADADLASARLADVDVADVDAPGLDVTGVGMPEVELQAANLSDVDFPTTAMPDADLDVDMPGLDVTGVGLPEVELPAASLADLDVPAVEVPSVEVPSVEVPSVEVPSGDLAGVAGLAGAGAVVAGPYAGSAAAREDRSQPEGYSIKGNEDSMLYHTVESPYYGRTIAEVWFDSEDNARAGGFTRWDERERAPKVAAFAALPAESSFGRGSADPLEGGASPHESFTIKGNADSMLYHTVESPYYGRTIAEVWFDSEDNARAGGFTRWDERERAPKVAAFAALPAESSFGRGSADPLESGASPHESFTIKGNADSMLYHTVESPYYGRTIAEVWFDSEENAVAGGFTRWDRR